MRHKGRLAVIASVLSIAAIVLAACGSNAGTGTTTTTPNGAAQVGEKSILPPVTNSAPVYGGTLKIVGSGDVDHLDTCCAYYTVTYEILRALSRNLVSYASSPSDPNPTTPVPDLATYSVSSNGLVYTFHIKNGVYWDEPTGKVQITSADAELGIKRLCNPVLPAPPLSYWENNISGMLSYCAAFKQLKLATNQATEITQLKNFIDTHQISGLATPNSSTFQITLIHPSSSFINIMAMPMSAPTPQTILNYLPGSIAEEQHFVSDGPYTLASFGPGGYNPGVSFHLVKNPYWSQATDPLRHQYVNAIDVTMGQNPTTIQQELQTGDADLEWDTTVPAADVQSLSSSKQYLAVYIGGITYLVFNMDSTADGGALQNPKVRIALQYCVNKRHVIQEMGGPGVNVASNQILAPQLNGFQKLDTYATANNEGDPAKCKAMLKAAGYPNGLTLTLAYPNNPPLPAVATALQSDFAAGGVTIKFNEQPSQGEYFVYIETPANKAHWDISFGLWFPDWQGNAAQSFFSPLVDGRLYANGSTDYGDYNDPTVNAGIDKALTAPTVAAASQEWASLDKYMMDNNPPWIPLVYQALPQFIGTNVEHAVYNGFLGYVDITDLWLK